LETKVAAAIMGADLLMRVPHAEKAVVPLRKVTGYMLSERHPVGRSKAAFFGGLGFHPSNASLLEKCLLTIVKEGEAVEIVESPHGTKYVVDGEIDVPLGGRVAVRTVWIVEPNQPRPRFVTAYPR
jgi:hypothetical protein